MVEKRRVAMNDPYWTPGFQPITCQSKLLSFSQKKAVCFFSKLEQSANHWKKRMVEPLGLELSNPWSQGKNANHLATDTGASPQKIHLISLILCQATSEWLVIGVWTSHYEMFACRISGSTLIFFDPSNILQAIENNLYFSKVASFVGKYSLAGFSQPCILLLRLFQFFNAQQHTGCVTGSFTLGKSHTFDAKIEVF